MARSWQYPRWRRVVMQVVLAAVFGLSLGLAGVVVRNKRLAAAVELGPAKVAELPGGGKVSVRLPVKWSVGYDAQMHPGRGRRLGWADSPPLFEADEEAEAAGGRHLRVTCKRVDWDQLPAVTLDADGSARAKGEAAGDPAGWHGRMDVAQTDGVWRVRRTADDDREYLAVGLVPTVGGGGWEVTVALTCPPVGDPVDDRGVLGEVARAVAVLPAGPTVTTAPAAGR